MADIFNHHAVQQQAFNLVLRSVFERSALEKGTFISNRADCMLVIKHAQCRYAPQAWCSTAMLLLCHINLRMAMKCRLACGSEREWSPIWYNMRNITHAIVEDAAVFNATRASSNAHLLLHLCLHLSTCWPVAFMSGSDACISFPPVSMQTPVFLYHTCHT